MTQAPPVPLHMQRDRFDPGEELPRILAEAFHLPSTGRPGPVLSGRPLRPSHPSRWKSNSH